METVLKHTMIFRINVAQLKEMVIYSSKKLQRV